MELPPFEDLDLDKLSAMSQESPDAVQAAKELPKEPEVPSQQSGGKDIIDVITEETPKEAPQTQEANATVVENKREEKIPEQEPNQEDSGEGDTELVKMLEDLIQGSEGIDKAQGDVQTSIDKTGDAKLKQDYANLLNQVDEQQALIREVQRKYDLLNKDYEKTLDEKLTNEVSSREKSKIYGAIENDDDLLSLVVYSGKVAEKPEYKEKIVPVLKTLLKKYGGIDVDTMSNKLGDAITNSMGDQPVVTNNISAKPTKEEGNNSDVMDMFESIG